MKKEKFGENFFLTMALILIVIQMIIFTRNSALSPILIVLTIADLFYYNKLNKENVSLKQEEEICNNIYDISLHISQKIANILNSYGYEEYIKKSQSLFVTVTSMFCFYYFKKILKEEYNYDEVNCNSVIEPLIEELASHDKNTTYNLALGAYKDIEMLLDKTPIEDKERYVASLFLVMSLDFDRDYIEDNLLLDIYDEFNSISKNIYNIA